MAERVSTKAASLAEAERLVDQLRAERDALWQLANRQAEQLAEIEAAWARREALTPVGYLNCRSGVLHRPKMDLRPEPWWVEVYARTDALAAAGRQP